LEDLLAQKKDLKYKADKLSIFILEKMLSDRRTDIGHGALKDYQDFVAKGPDPLDVEQAKNKAVKAAQEGIMKEDACRIKAAPQKKAHTSS